MNVAFWLFAIVALLVWFTLTGRAGVPEWCLGVPVVLSAWGILQRLVEAPLRLTPGRSPTWLRGVVGYLVGFVLPEIPRATFRVFVKVLQARQDVHSVILAVRIPEASRAALILLAYGISLTPGQLIVDIDADAHVLYVHVLEAADPEAERQEILALYERYLKEVV
ncbi:Na+/H+ antiporter subunit E [bacterium]|nr:Na+/H+ antiporter subunit E [bacterium]